MRESDERDRAALNLKRDRCGIENCPGGTHPGTEQGAVRGGLVVSMVPSMLDRLRLCKSADRKDTEY